MTAEPTGWWADDAADSPTDAPNPANGRDGNPISGGPARPGTWPPEPSGSFSAHDELLADEILGDAAASERVLDDQPRPVGRSRTAPDDGGRGRRVAFGLAVLAAERLRPGT